MKQLPLKSHQTGFYSSLLRSVDLTTYKNLFCTVLSSIKRLPGFIFRLYLDTELPSL